MRKPNSKQPNLAPEVKAFTDKLAAEGGKPLYELSYKEARNVLRNVQSVHVEKEVVDITDMNLPVGGGGKAKIRIMRPEDAKEALPVIFYIHGGGWVMGDEVTHDRLIRELCVKTNAAVVFPIYIPSPDAQYPSQIETLFAVLEFIAQNAKDLNFKPQLAVAGDSVGGNMATVMALMAKDRGYPEIDFQLLLYPVTSAEMNTKSYQDFAEGPWLTQKAMEWFWDAYFPDKSKRLGVTASPLNASKKELKGMPPAMVITAENDVLRDEGEAYAKKLADAGVDVTAMRMEGTIHDFMMLNSLADSKATKEALVQSVRALKQVFEADEYICPETGVLIQAGKNHPKCKNTSARA